ncbi:MAG: alkyl hydroperoxide reductase [Polyangiaceae bacterium]|jgi:alkyl hydroperoxide reductase subunit D|nr:alkyl hydroperoxide reductase [Polyangiaceae bacterium]
MEQTAKLAEGFPDVAKDIRINLQNVLQPGTLTADQVWGTAIACAHAARNDALKQAIEADARAAGIGDGVVADAKAAAVLMGMNNVIYRFKHVVGKEDYEKKPIRLRMQRLAQVTSNKTDFELFCLAVSAINNCQNCMAAHEAAVIKQGLTEDHVWDSVRIAAIIHAAAFALEV